MTQEQRDTKIKELIAQRDAFVERLDKGVITIEEGKAKGIDSRVIEHWESAWIQLLRQYERTCDAIRELQQQGATYLPPVA